MARAQKIRASKQPYVSASQLTLEGFETPFATKLDPNNRWVIMRHRLPWDEIVSMYNKQMKNAETGAGHINAQVVIGSLIIKHLCNLSDEETIMQIQENMYMQYFIGYSGFSTEAPFDPSLFVEIRKRLGIDKVNAINEKIYELYRKRDEDNDCDPPTPQASLENEEKESTADKSDTHQGQLIVDATACPQDISYPTDLKILDDAREKSEMLIDALYCAELHGEKKPRTYRKKARKVFLNTAQKRNKTRKEIRKAIGAQLRFLRRNIGHIHRLLDAYDAISLDAKQYKYLLVIQHTYDQQNGMYENRTHSVEHRIVSIHQPHIRPIVRGKEKAKTEFGAKLHLSLNNGFAFIDHLDWEAYNEGTLLMDSVEQYKRRNGFLPAEVLADKIYCNRENRRQLKDLGIRLKAKPLGRPSAVKTEHVRPGERNPIEGKFGQAKSSYGLDRIKARQSDTSESWIASIILVLNLVKLAGQVPLALIRELLEMILAMHKHKRSALLFQ